MSRAIVSSVSLCSVSIFSRSSEVSRRSVRSRIAWAWIWVSLNWRIRPAARGLRVLGRANQLDHRVEVLERDEQPLEDMQAGLGLAQFELRAPREHDLAMVDEGEQHLAQVELARAALVDREHDESVALLHLGELVELVEHDLAARRRA